jgi:hypothetical protein
VTKAPPVVRLVRTGSDEQGTPGRLVCDEIPGLALNTLELPWRLNQRRRSCIPAGLYTCAAVQSPRFGHVYEVRRVPDRSHILIHPGNVAGDVDQGWASHLEGCIALGERRGQIKTGSGRWQRAVLVSRPAVERLHAALRMRPFVLEVVGP